MKRSSQQSRRPPERVFLDSNVIRGQLTTDILMSLAAKKAIDLRWSDEVMREAREHRPEDLSEEAINHRFNTMNHFLPHGRVTGYEHLMAEMQVRDGDDRHVLAAAVHSDCVTLVTENEGDFNPPANGRNHIRVERLSDFLGRKLDEEPNRTRAGLRSMLERNKRAPQTFPELVDEMAKQQPLKGFARELNHRLPTNQRGTIFSSSNAIALDGVQQAGNPVSRSGAGNEHRPHTPQPRGPELDREPRR